MALAVGANVLGMEEVLLVDDDSDALHLVKNVLQQAGLAVHCAQNGEEALLALKKKSFHLMITDLNMPPGMNGFTLARKAAKIAPRMPIIMSTGDISPEIPRFALDAGITTVLAKPFRPDELLEIVKNVIEEVDDKSP